MVRFVLVILIQAMIIYTVQPSTDCQTPGSNSGRCVLVQDCPFIRSLAATVKDAADQNYLMKFRCGTDPATRKPLVCCPEVKSAPDCGRITLVNNIVGGEDTELDEFPWTVMLAYDKKGSPVFMCGGSLINDRYAVTAAHCVVGLRSWKLKAIRLGEWDTESHLDCKEEDTGSKTCNKFPHTDILVEKEIPHELYNRSSPIQEHDIALLKLARAAPKTHAISPICLPSAKMIRSMRVDTQLFTVAGWGKTYDFKNTTLLPYSTRKQKVTLPGQLMDRCNRAILSKAKLTFTQNQLCVGGQPGKDSCKGDSGGPLMVIDDNQWHLAGIVSYGARICGSPGVPGIYTRMDKYLDWVAGKIELEAREVVSPS